MLYCTLGSSVSFAQIMLYRSDNYFTIVEGINPGAEVLPAVLMKGPPSNVGTPVEQIVLADSNRLPENGLFEIRDTCTSRRIHPSELVFAGPVAQTEKMTETGLNATGKDRTSGCGCTNPETFRLSVTRFCIIWKDR